MSTQPFEMAVASTRSVLENVSAEQLGESTPCASWDVRGLINHLIDAQGFFVAGIEGRPPSGGDTDHCEGDFLAAYDDACAGAVAAFSADGALEKMVDMGFAQMPGAGVMGLAINDTFTHGWDLAKATGQSTDLNPQLAEQVLASAQQMIQPAFRGDEGAPFGAEQQAPEGACAADRLAAFLGREV